MKRMSIFFLIMGVIFQAGAFAETPVFERESSDLNNALCTNRIQDLKRMMRNPEEPPAADFDANLIPPRQFGINVNQSGLELEYGENRSVGYPMVMNYGGEARINGDFATGAFKMGMGSEITKYLTVDMGLKALIGKIESDNTDGNMASIGLYTSGVYDNRSSTGIPFEITGMICMAPRVLSFIDAEEYLSFKTSLGIHIFPNKRGVVFVGLRYTEIRIEDDKDVTEARPFIGFRFRF